MSTVLTVYLKDGARFTVESDLDKFERALEDAAQRGVMVRVTNGNGRTYAINPTNVSIIESRQTDDAATQSRVRPLAQA